MAAKQNGEILNHGFRERQGLPSNPDDPVMSQRQQEHVLPVLAYNIPMAMF